jgi:hypothetical protein
MMPMSNTVPRLTVTYKGQTTTLEAPSDIAAWIAERKKRFPTKARIESKKAEDAQRREKREAQNKLKNANAKSTPTKEESKAMKIQRRLRKMEEKVAKAKAAMEKAQRNAEAGNKRKREDDDTDNSGPSKEITSPDGVGPSTIPLAESVPDENQPTETSTKRECPKPPAVSNDTHSASVSGESDDISDGSMSMSDTESTSSSGSSSSDADPDHEPDELPLRPSEPLRVPPPQREKLSAICRSYRSTGRCSFGAGCRFSHVVPQDEMKANATLYEAGRRTNDRGEHVSARRGPREKKKRKSLYQRVSSS